MALDVKISQKIDKDFVTDLRTIPKRTMSMQEEIKASVNKPPKIERWESLAPPHDLRSCPW